MALFFSGRSNGLFVQLRQRHENFTTKSKNSAPKWLLAEFPKKASNSDHSESIVDGHFVGLVVDEVNEPELTEQRVQVWAQEVLSAVGNTAVAV